MNGQSERNRPFTDPERWRQFIEYNRQDVLAERRIMLHLGISARPGLDWDEYVFDQEINDRGIAVDTEMIGSAQALDTTSRGELTAELAKRTSLANPNSVSQIRAWLTDHGKEVESLGTQEALIDAVRAQIPKGGKAA